MTYNQMQEDSKQPIQKFKESPIRNNNKQDDDWENSPPDGGRSGTVKSKGSNRSSAYDKYNLAEGNVETEDDAQDHLIKKQFK